MPRGGNNNQNLRPIKTLSKEEAKERGRKGGKASGEVRAKKRTTREILEMLDNLPVLGGNKDVLSNLGLPEEEQTQQALRLVGLHKKAVAGDAAANRLLLEIKGEAQAQTVNIGAADETVTEIKISFVDKSDVKAKPETDPKIVGEYTQGINTEDE